MASGQLTAHTHVSKDSLIDPNTTCSLNPYYAHHLRTLFSALQGGGSALSGQLTPQTPQTPVSNSAGTRSGVANAAPALIGGSGGGGSRLINSGSGTSSSSSVYSRPAYCPDIGWCALFLLARVCSCLHMAMSLERAMYVAAI